MAYITYDQYTELYGTPPLSQSDFAVYATSASDLIDSITQYRIERLGGLNALPAPIQSLVEKATGVQIMYFVQNGGLESVLSGQTGAGYTVGKVHIDGGNAGGMTQAQLMISPMVRAMLEQTGLMGRRTVCLDPYHSSYYGIW